MDSEQPLHLIEQLVPLLREKDFDEIFNRLTQNENTNGRFLLKMELKRKCTPFGTFVPSAVAVTVCVPVDVASVN